MPYKIFLGLASVASLYSITINLLQMRLLTNKGFETIKDDLQKHAEEYILAHLKIDGKKPSTIEEFLRNGDVAAAGVNGFGRMKTSAESIYKAAAAIHPGAAGSEEDDTTPDWLKTFYLRHEEEVKLAEEIFLRNRLFCQIFILSFEDLPFLSMNLDLIAGSGIFGCSDFEFTPLFVFFAVLAALMSGIKINQVLGRFGRHGIKQKIKDLSASVEALTVTGLRQYSRRASEINRGAVEEANIKFRLASLVEKEDENIALKAKVEMLEEKIQKMLEE